MPSFAVRVSDSAGRTRKRRIEAPSAGDARATATSTGDYCLSVEATSTRGRSLGRRNSHVAAAHAARQIASLLHAGLPLPLALEVATRAAGSSNTGGALDSVLRVVKDGGTVSQALGREEDLFPPVGVGIIAAGERAGTLPEAFGRLAEYLERREEQRRRLVAALSYPAFMLVAGLATVAILLVVVLPRFSGMLEASGVALPSTTAALLAIGEYSSRWGPILLLMAGGSGLAGVVALRRDDVRRRGHRRLLALPVVGSWRRSLVAIQIGESLSSLLGQGVPVLNALEASATATPDLEVRARLRSATAEVRAGSTLSASLAATGVFPPVFVEMLRVGEQGGAVPELLHRGAMIEQQELDRRAQSLARYAEPAMIIGLGVFIGFIALALLQAVYGMQAGVAA